MKLTQTQQGRLDNALDAHVAHKEIKGSIEYQVRQIIAQRVERSQFERDRAIAAAVQAGVPKNQIREYLRISPNAVTDAVKRLEGIDP